MSWSNQADMHSHGYKCGYCGWEVASVKGFTSNKDNQQYAYICPRCNGLSVFDDYRNRQLPGPLFGSEVKALPENVESAYREARQCYAAGAFTGCVLLCRKLLMNLAVEHGAKAGESFAGYVDFLASAGFIPPNGKAWVDRIRTKGNEATHQIAIMTKDDASALILFSQGLLQFIYEFPSMVEVKS